MGSLQGMCHQVHPRRSLPNHAFMCIPLSITTRQISVDGGIENESVDRELDICEGASDLLDLN